MNRVRFTFVRDGFNRTAVAALVASLEDVVEDAHACLRTAARDELEALKFGPASAISDIVCFSTMTPRAAMTIDIHRRLRRKWGSAFTSICGGAHASGAPMSLLEAGIDYCCMGEGEDAVRAVYRAVARGRPLQSVSGLFRLEKGNLRGRMTEAPVDIEHYNALPLRIQFPTYIEIGRGCRWMCLYCQTPRMHGTTERYRSPERVEEVVRRYAGFGMRDFRFLLPNTLGYMSTEPGLPNCAALEELLARSSKTCGEGRIFLGSFPSEVRPDYVTEEALQVLRRYVSNSGLVIGGQSGSPPILDAVKRGHGVEAIQRACDISLACGFEPSVDLVLGFPGETAEDRAATVELIEHLGGKGVMTNMHFFMPLPGTSLEKARPVFLNECIRTTLDTFAQQGILRGRWRRQERLSKKWVCP